MRKLKLSVQHRIDETRAQLLANHRWRAFHSNQRTGAVTATFEGRDVVSFCSNDYLGLANDPRLTEAANDAARRLGWGAGGSRYITGNHPLYAALERRTASIKHCEAAMVFGSGYLANLAAVSSL